MPKESSLGLQYLELQCTRLARKMKPSATIKHCALVLAFAWPLCIERPRGIGDALQHGPTTDTQVVGLS